MSRESKEVKPQETSRGPRGPGGNIPKGPVDKPKDFKGTGLRLIGYIAQRKTQLIAVFFVSILSTVFMIFSPKILGLAITQLFNDMVEKMQGVPGAAINFIYIRNVLLVLTGLHVLSSLFRYLQQYIMAGVAQNTSRDIRKEIDDKLTKLPLSYYDSNTHGEILSRVTNDMDNISNTLQQSIAQLITSVVTMIGVVIMMLTISPMMTLITLVTLPIMLLVTRPIIKRSQIFFKDQQDYLGEINGHVEEMYAGHVVVKAFGQEEASIKEFEKINEELYGASWRALFVSGIMMPLMTFINNIGYVFICVVGGVFATRGVINIGDIQAFLQYSRQFTQPINQLANIANVFQSTIASAERVFEILDEKEELEELDGEMVIEDIKGSVEFVDVNFGYTKDQTLINDMNIKVEPGQMVAIVGPTGAGKTTLINLLMRFYDVDSGKILVDGIDINDLKRENLRDLFGMVLQDTWLFNGTIRDNIAYGKEDASEEDIINAAKSAYADHFIRTLPEGYDTVLNQESSNISQGQKQLLTIARAILKNSKLLILDEATSSVDTRTEQQIQKAMEELMKGRTSFVIAHRLSTIIDADIILVMVDGDIVEKGSHFELMENDGFYADLYNSQFTESA